MYDDYAAIRDSKGFSDYAVAKGSGIGRSTLSDWKKGTHTPSTQNLQKIAAFLNVSIEQLITGRDPEDADASLYAKMKRDPTFWNYAKMTYFLPPAYQEQIYDYIEMVSAKADREKETVSA